jgi:CheY-like chemotaxis protein
MLAMLRQLPDFAHVPAVAITASVMNEEIAKLRTAGFNGCVAKPIDMDTFPDCVEQLLKGEAVWRIVG